MARELHDQIIQSLIGLSYQLSRLSRPQNDRTPVRRGLGELRATVGQIQDDLRRICRRSSAQNETPGTLVATLQSHIQRLRQTTGLEISLLLEGDPHQPLGNEISLCLLRIAQEGLTNIQKHADAQRVAVQLALGPHEVTLTIQDDGVGFVVPPQLGRLAQERHFGLVGMYERLEEFQGSFQIYSAPGQGTCLIAQVPLYSPVPAEVSSSPQVWYASQ